MAMEQKQIDKVKEEERKKHEEKLRLMREQEKPPSDDLEGLRVHAWVLVLPGSRDIDETFFIEPTRGCAYPLGTDVYNGIESVWNDLNYWVNTYFMRD